MALPKPVWSNDDIQELDRNPSSLTWHNWSKNPTKLAVVRAIASCQVRIGHDYYFGWDMVQGLAQRPVCFLHFYSLGVEEALLNSFQTLSSSSRIFTSLSKNPDFWGSPVGDVPEENHEASYCRPAFVTPGA